MARKGRAPELSLVCKYFSRAVNLPQDSWPKSRMSFSTLQTTFENRY